jgi:signal transduction histidine kinase
MKLAAFIQLNIERIAREWEAFAATLLPEEEFSRSMLRDGIVDMLTEIATDMDLAQTAIQQKEKSESDPPADDDTPTPAVLHALARIRMGLSTRQLLAEFRGLRATVIRLWENSLPTMDKAAIYELTRFNEALDQALTEATIRFTEEVDRSRELFLGILGHDLINPLTAIIGLAELQLRARTPEDQTTSAIQIGISARRMAHMITDLVELTRVRLGAGIAISPSAASLRDICTGAIDEMRAIYPNRVFHFDCPDALEGSWDESRMFQVLSNLLGNAVQHGGKGTPITVRGRKQDDAITIEVHNHGTVVPPEMIPKLFDCLVQGNDDHRDAEDHSASLGLGLYIAKEIVVAHGGEIGVQSADGSGTTFIARLPVAARGVVARLAPR